MSTLKIVGLSLLIGTGLLASALFAQNPRNKALGRVGQGFWSPNRNQATARGQFDYYGTPRAYSVPQVAESGEDSYRSFSYAPIGIRAGDAAEVRLDGARLMRGANVLGTLPVGTEFTVTKVVNGWLGTSVEVNGERLNGWVWHQDVAKVADAAGAE